MGFVLGKTIVFPNATANPYNSDTGRYQLVAGEINITGLRLNTIGIGTDEFVTDQNRTIFRINTVNGNVEMLNGIMNVADSSRNIIVSMPNWIDISSTHEIPLDKYNR
jgi:hypothetical protein